MKNVLLDYVPSGAAVSKRCCSAPGCLDTSLFTLRRPESTVVWLAIEMVAPLLRQHALDALWLAVQWAPPRSPATIAKPPACSSDVEMPRSATVATMTAELGLARTWGPMSALAAMKTLAGGFAREIPAGFLNILKNAN